MKIIPCIIGLGYVGLPIALSLANKFLTYGFDINKERKQKIESLGEHNYSNRYEINQRFAEIQRLIKKLRFNNIGIGDRIDTFEFLCDIYNLLFKKRKMNALRIKNIL